MFLRDKRKLTKIKLCNAIKNSIILNKIFTFTDPNLIAEAIIMELNAIIDFISPVKKIQFKNDYVPYYTKEIREGLKNKGTF